MNDGIIKGTGNSRFLKSAISDDMTWEQFKALIRAGTLPIDLFGINPAGWDVIGTALSKANLLTDETAELLELTGNPTVNDALAKIAGRSRMQIFSYTGTGRNYVLEGTEKVFTFTFAPRVLMLFNNFNTIFFGAPRVAMANSVDGGVGGVNYTEHPLIILTDLLTDTYPSINPLYPYNSNAFPFYVSGPSVSAQFWGMKKTNAGKTISWMTAGHSSGEVYFGTIANTIGYNYWLLGIGGIE